MEGDHDLTEQIARAEAQHGQAAAANQQAEAAILAHQHLISSLLAQIQAVQLPEHAPDTTALTAQLQQLARQRETLDHSLMIQSQSYTAALSSHASELSTAQQRHAQLNSHLTADTGVPDSRLADLRAEAAKAQASAQELQTLLGQEQKAIEALEVQTNHTTSELSAVSTLQQECEAQQKHAHESSGAQQALLAAELHALEQELLNYDSEIQAANQEQTAAAASLTQQNDEARLKLAQTTREHASLTAESNRLLALIKETEAQSPSNTTDNDTTISRLEQEAREKENSIEEMKRTASGLRDEIRREEERIKEEQRKAQRQKNYKELTLQAKTEHETLLLAKEREQNILSNALKTKATYVSRDNLAILQRELTRHTDPKAASLDALSRDSDRLQRRHSNLTDGIRRLQSLAVEAEGREERTLGEARKKRDHLTGSKLEVDRELTEVTYKLNEYIKKFPEHEQNAEARKKFKAKKTESHLDHSPPKDHSAHTPHSDSNEEPAPKPHKKKKHQPAEEEFVILQDGELPEEPPISRSSEMFRKTKWYRRRSSDDLLIEPEKPFYHNHYFQAAALLFILLVLAVPSF